ncbi:MAG TPA: hypothetical protein ENK21_02570 [Trueperaceae bacterium]|nr:hypothetical protein [Trueperaceae bacterium]
MARAKRSRGKCNYCLRELTKTGMAKHLQSCKKLQKEIAIANQGSGLEQELFHLELYDSYGKDFWLQIEINSSTTFADLDYYLREIWLECCGHLSRFSIGGWLGEEIPKDSFIADVVAPGVELTHIYDFGSSSETTIKYIGQRKAKALSQNPIVLMARNNLPERYCEVCGEPATHICLECFYESDASGFLCDRHTKSHPHDEYGGPLALINSPRMGICGYDGPAEPPY